MPKAPSIVRFRRAAQRSSCALSSTSPPYALASESLCRSYPAACGRRASVGQTNLQSRSSNKAANIAGDARITPSAIGGQTYLQPSRRLCTNTRLVLSQTKILIRSARFDRNTKAAPLNGSRRSICCTFAAAHHGHSGSQSAASRCRSSDQHLARSS